MKEKVFASVDTDLVSQRINLYITRPNYEAKLNRQLHNDRVGGAIKVQKSFQLQQMQLFNSVKSLTWHIFTSVSQIGSMKKKYAMSVTTTEFNNCICSS